MQHIPRFSAKMGGQRRHVRAFLANFNLKYLSRSVDQIHQHFSRYFTLHIANDEHEKRLCYQTRHQVFAEELKQHLPSSQRIDNDEFDAYSVIGFVRHKSSGACAGTVRLVLPHHAGQPLPVERAASAALRLEANHPHHFHPTSICEISKLAIPAHFRRRSVDRGGWQATADGVHPQADLQNSRLLPYLGMALYFLAFSLSRYYHVQYGYVVLQPRMARTMALLGIELIPVGKPFEQHGQRQAYLYMPERVLTALPPNLRSLQKAMIDNLTRRGELPSFQSFRHNKFQREIPE
ncbi:PEP-CTERM/exosortase system-associated acyltransferase [Bowmanella sp. JS7-9]|uniref:PEP-CTERM/exosortase system-associated acyltransferase n=1 Tax=Pseudobowmanella zhangzhouensis TaxID=1537679 RepID=A0ABW1XJT1_9ALTE|nr:PEP-CTERM/exosortase system-associated acyltransferase [Bowmanella sp. JS7-9]TBX27317.1 hypothetical protein TK45_00770 [Bowmanella sp. JS7-9]